MSMFKRRAILAAAISLGLGLSSISMADTEFRGKYFSMSSTLSGQSSGVTEAVLIDIDLVRNNNFDEAVITLSNNPLNTNPFEFFTGSEKEQSLVVIFDDGTTLEDVKGLYQSVSLSFSSSHQLFLIDANELAAAGKSIDNVVEAIPVGDIEHHLNWSDLGFAEVQLEQPDPAPTTEDIILGTDANDNLKGTEGVDVFLSGGGNRDRMTGGESGDYFVVGADVNNGTKNTDVINDFDPNQDVLVVEQNARIYNVKSRNGNFIIRLQGDDKDRVVLKNSGITSLPEIKRISFTAAFNVNEIQPTSNRPPVRKPLPDPVVTASGIVSWLGTTERDHITGTANSDAIDGLTGNDVATGRQGADYFLFGSSTNNGATERDIILDFDLAEDTLVLEQGATATSFERTPNGLNAYLSGADQDLVFILDNQSQLIKFEELLIEFVEGDFLK